MGILGSFSGGLPGAIAKEKEVVIGQIGPLTDGAAFLGVDALNGALRTRQWSLFKQEKRIRLAKESLNRKAKAHPDFALIYFHPDTTFGIGAIGNLVPRRKLWVPGEPLFITDCGCLVDFRNIYVDKKQLSVYILPKINFVFEYNISSL